jgi:hypothetical protein
MTKIGIVNTATGQRVDPDGAYVGLTGDQTVSGIKTFSSYPLLPEAAPTADREAASKKYVDDNAGGGGGGPATLEIVNADLTDSKYTFNSRVTVLNIYSNTGDVVLADITTTSESTVIDFSHVAPLTDTWVIEYFSTLNTANIVTDDTLTGSGTAADPLEVDYPVLPSTRLDNYNHTEFVRYLSRIHAKNTKIGFTAGTYAHGVTAVASAYTGGVYSPTQNRIYMMPTAQANQINWHYIDCATGAVVAYAHGVTAVASAYIGGVYSPTQNRIYLMPFAQANQTNWHYIDCATGNVVAYSHGVTAVASAYHGGVYSPTQNRIYMVPRVQSDQTNWHYIDCATGNVVAYAHGVTAVATAYAGGVYSPTQNRIYLMPLVQANQTNWHYIQEFSQSEISPSIAANTLFNKL